MPHDMTMTRQTFPKRNAHGARPYARSPAGRPTREFHLSGHGALVDSGRRMMMINFRNAMAALALAAAVAAAASPAMAAQKRAHATHPGYAARAQALPGQEVPGEGTTMTPARERALRECSEIA